MSENVTQKPGTAYARRLPASRLAAFALYLLGLVSEHVQVAALVGAEFLLQFKQEIQKLLDAVREREQAELKAREAREARKQALQEARAWRRMLVKRVRAARGSGVPIDANLARAHKGRGAVEIANDLGRLHDGAKEHATELALFGVSPEFLAQAQGHIQTLLVKDQEFTEARHHRLQEKILELAERKGVVYAGIVRLTQMGQSVYANGPDRAALFIIQVKKHGPSAEAPATTPPANPPAAQA